MNITGYLLGCVWPIILLFSTFFASVLVSSDVSSPIRSVLVFWFLLVCPGMAYVRMLDIKDTLTEWILAVSLSLGTATAVSLVVLYSGNWNASLVMAILVVLTFGGVALQILRLGLTALQRTLGGSG